MAISINNASTPEMNTFISTSAYFRATDLLTLAWTRPGGSYFGEFVKELQENHSSTEPLEQGRALEADSQRG